MIIFSNKAPILIGIFRSEVLKINCHSVCSKLCQYLSFVPIVFPRYKGIPSSSEVNTFFHHIGNIRTQNGSFKFCFIWVELHSFPLQNKEVVVVKCRLHWLLFQTQLKIEFSTVIAQSGMEVSCTDIWASQFVLFVFSNRAICGFSPLPLFGEQVWRPNYR